MGYGIAARDIMTRRPVVISADATAYEAAKKMVLMDVGSLLIVENKFLKGIITQRTFLKEVILKMKNPKKIKVSDIMERNLIVGKEEDDLFDIIQLMRKNGIRRIPIVKNGVLKGIVTQKDVLTVAPGLIDMLLEMEHIREPDFKLKIRTSERSGICEICGNYSEHLKLINGRWICEKCEEELYGRNNNNEIPD